MLGYLPCQYSADFFLIGQILQSKVDTVKNCFFSQVEDSLRSVKGNRVEPRSKPPALTLVSCGTMLSIFS